MRYNRLIPFIAVVVGSSLLMGFANGKFIPRAMGQAASLEDVTRAGNKAIVEGDWAAAESHFREAVRLAPRQGFWRIQLVLVLGQQKKWKAAFVELDPLLRGGADDWILTLEQKLLDGKVGFVNTETFGHEQYGIPRYAKALKENKPDEVLQDIRIKLGAFGRKHKFALIYDISKLKSLPFESGKTVDVTSDFIAYYKERESEPQQFGTVYLYRGDDTPDYGTQIVVGNPEAAVYLDGQEFLSMPERTFVGFKVPAGRYVLHMSWKNIRRVLEVDPDTTYYLLIKQDVYPVFFQMMADVDEKSALKEIRKNWALKEKNIKLKRFEVRKDLGSKEKP